MHDMMDTEIFWGRGFLGNILEQKNLSSFSFFICISKFLELKRKRGTGWTWGGGGVGGGIEGVRSSKG